MKKRKRYPWEKSDKHPTDIKYGLPWCVKHDSYAPRRYDPFVEEVYGRKVAKYICDICYDNKLSDI